MKRFYTLLAFCFLLSLFQSNASVSDEQPTSKLDKKKSNTHKTLDCGIPAPTIVNYNCLDVVWEKNYKRINSNYTQFSESPTKVYPTADGGYIFASSSQFYNVGQGAYQYSYLVTKVDGDGNKLWSKVFDTAFKKERLVSFVQTSDGGYILGGDTDAGISGMKTTSSQGYNDIWLIKIDANGNKVWDKSFGGSDQDYLLEMISTSDGGFLLASSSTSPVSGDKTEAVIGGSDAWVIKINANGVKQWDKVFGGTANEGPRALSETNDGYLLGSLSLSDANGNKTAASKGDNDFWVVKMNLTGNKIWDNTYGGNGSDLIETINKNSDGSFILGGHSNSSIGGDKSLNSRGLYDTWIVKINASGTKIWDKTVGGNDNDFLSSVTTTPAGNLVFNIQSYSGISGDKKHSVVSPNNTDQWLFEINPNGTMLWEKYLNGQVFHRKGDIIIQGNYLIILGMPDMKTLSGYSNSENIALKRVSFCQSQTVNSTTICKGKSTVISAEGCTSGVVRWSNGVYGASQNVSPITTQNYKVVCLSADSTCVGDSSTVFTINVNTSDNIVISPTGFIELTCGESQTITATGCANGSISWSNGQTGNPLTFIPSTTQTIRAICTMPNGCVSESDYLGLTVYNISGPSIFGMPSQPVCAGQPLTFSTNCSNGIANWTGGRTGNTITITPTSTFTLRVACTYPNGCISDSSHTYPSDTVKVNPSIAILTVANYNCLKKVWDKRFGGDAPEYLSKILKVAGGYLLAGSTYSTNGDKTEPSRGSIDYWLVKIDNNGNKLWDKTYGGTGMDFLSDIIELSDGNFIIVGGSYSDIGGDKTEPSRGGWDFWLVKIDNNGNKLWDKTYGGSSDERGFRSQISIKETNDGFILAGTSASGISGDKTTPAIANSSSHIWVLKLNQQGTKIWEKTFGGSIGEEFVSMSLLENNEYLLLGNAISPANTNVGNKTSLGKGGIDYWLVKIDANGNKVWDRSYGGSEDDYARGMVYTNDGKITIMGSSTSNKSGDKSRNSIASSSDIWIIKVDTSGNKYWDKTYGSSGGDFGESIIKMPNGGYIVSSTSDSYKSFDRSENVLKVPTPQVSSTADYWVLGLSVNGEKLWDKSFGGPTFDERPDVLIDGNAIVFAGSSMSNIGADKSQNAYNGSSDYWVVKMDYCQPTIGSSTIICKNDSTFLTAQGCPNESTVKWSNNETAQTISVKPTSATTYKAICISTTGLCQSDSSAAYTVNIIFPSITATKTNLCTGENTTLTASGCQGTYGWTGGVTTASITVSPTVTKTYKVACTVNGCTSDSTSTMITVTAVPTKPIITTPNQNVCTGNNITLSASGCDNGVYQWTGGLTGSSIIVTPMNPTSNYKVACKTSSCVSDSSTSVTITTMAKPSAPTITPPTNTTICQGQSVSLIASTCTGGTLTWTGGLTGSSISVSPSVNTNYTVTCTANNCVSNSSSPVAIAVINTIETLKSGSWTDVTTWSCNRVPTATDDVIINAGHTITDSGNILRAKSLNYRGGILKIATTTSLRLVNP